jgi:hypothetical protein
LSILRILLSVIVVVCSLLAPSAALAWDPPAGSPPGWQPYWVRTTDAVDAYMNAGGDASFGQLPAGLFFRVDAPEQHGRLWTYNPVLDSWAWLPVLSTEPVGEPTQDEVASSGALVDPRSYLYAQAPDLAPRLDCIITGESGWDPLQVNVRTHAAGLAQFLPSTWAATPQGQLGESPFEPQANIDAAIWLARTKGWRQWQVYTDGFCR